MTVTAMFFAISLAGFLSDDDGKPRSTPSGPTSWRYVVPAPGDPFEHAPFRALVLGREKPEELIEKVVYRGDAARRRYARVRFGSSSSTRVTLVLDTTASGEVDLYADADRNLKIDDRDRVSNPAVGSRHERIWRLPLDVALVENGAVRTVARAVVFRLGVSGQTLGYAVAGYLEGQVTADRVFHARRVDGDGNGLLVDGQDRIWIDLNGDGRFDPMSEQFGYASVLNLEGSRYVVLSDELGGRLAFQPLAGTGTIRLALPGKEPLAHSKSIEIAATAIGRDGSVFGLTATEPAIVPAGHYRLGGVTIGLDDILTGRRWSFVFADDGTGREPHWYKVDKDAEVTIDPIGTPRFELKLKDHARAARPGEVVELQPALYTGDGLLIVAGYCGEPLAPAVQESLGARIVLNSSDGRTLTTAHSGFS